MISEYLTTPWQNQNSQTVLQELKKQGLDAEIEANGKFAKIIVGKKTITVDLSQPIWVIMAEIGKAEVENKQQEIKDYANNRSKYYKNLYNKIVEEIEESKIKSTEFLKHWENARNSYNKILCEYNADNWRKITNPNDKKLAQEYSNSATDNKFSYIAENNWGFSLCNTATDYALEAWYCQA